MGASVSFLRHANGRWAKWALALCVLAIAGYAAWAPVGGRNGGTAAGYALGGVGAALILWLSWLGVRKRRFASKRSRLNPAASRRLAADPPTTLRGWTSAHVYLGLSLLVIATLHTGFEFGWNIHTLAYALMVLVILSGAWLIYAYSALPAAMSANLPGKGPERLRRRIADLDTGLALRATRLPDAFAAPVRRALRETSIGGGPITLLRGSNRSCAAAAALAEANAAAASDHGADPREVSELVAALAEKARLTAVLRRDAALKARMEAALWVHVPVTIALIAALVAHVLSVFFYW
jgi:hypothetical protein